MKIIFLPRAQQEYEEALGYYSDRSAAVALDFEVELLELLHLAAKSQSLGVAVPGYGYKLKLSNYPYLVLYRREIGQIVIITVFHGARNPNEFPGYSP